MPFKANVPTREGVASGFGAAVVPESIWPRPWPGWYGAGAGAACCVRECVRARPRPCYWRCRGRPRIDVAHRCQRRCPPRMLDRQTRRPGDGKISVPHKRGVVVVVFGYTPLLYAQLFAMRPTWPRTKGRNNIEFQKKTTRGRTITNLLLYQLACFYEATAKQKTNERFYIAVATWFSQIRLVLSRHKSILIVNGKNRWL